MLGFFCWRGGQELIEVQVSVKQKILTVFVLDFRSLFSFTEDGEGVDAGGPQFRG